MQTYNWDFATRATRLWAVPGTIEIHEFDYLGENQVVYEQGGVTVRSWPAVHTGDGPVSYALELKGYKIVIGGDSALNKWYVKYAKDADVAIHECFHTPGQMAEWYNQAPAVALWLSTQGHTSPQAFGKIMSTIEPRHAIGYHFFNEEGTRYAIYEGVRETYSGPVSMATDNMVWNITKEGITERMAVITEDAWSVAGVRPPPLREGGPATEMTEKILSGRWSTMDVEGRMIQDYADEHGIDMDSIMERATK